MNASPQAAVLAIDGGNSKTDVALIAFDGAVLGRATGPGSNAQQIGLDQAFAVLDGLVAAAADQAGPADRWRPGTAVAHHTLACLAGADLPEEEQSLGAAVRARGWSGTSRVVNDTFAVLRAGSPDGCGVAVTCGAGINCVGVAADGRVARFPALGRLTGDWGGGDDLSKEVLWWAGRAEDGRGPQTSLATAVADHFTTATVHDAAIGIHFGRIPPARVHGLTYVLFAAAAAGDAVAHSLVTRMAEEVVGMAAVAAGRLGPTDETIDVVLGGGLMRARDPILTAALHAGLARELPKARVHILDLPPIVGAAMLGLDQVAGPGAAANLRATFAADLGHDGVHCWWARACVRFPGPPGLR
ncbi:BadF/BadG/BcrA/BcrD ATPase family protein [Dactylosporangium sp. NPDC049140]|uniref:N-acetylglucosamine kinase n=1 Tax=Dactylosporangium sp. NPDC049140 TaxID=3155647 RepID=UPI0033EA15C9